MPRNTFSRNYFQMKNVYINACFIVVAIFCAFNSHAQNPQHWTSKQLIEPAVLAENIKAKKDLPVIISVGPGAPIPTSLENGMVNNKEGLDKLKGQLTNISKDKKIVVYCGCCPFEHCPNVRPAVNALKEMNFTNYYLLNLPHNIKKDWIDEGYPVTQ
jgi:rhodanese-related sulfurtransferase